MGETKNGICFLCGQPAEVETDPGESTGYRCNSCGAYDIAEKDRPVFKQWIEDPIRHPRLKLAVEHKWVDGKPLNPFVPLDDIRMKLDAEWLRKLEIHLQE